VFCYESVIAKIIHCWFSVFKKTCYQKKSVYSAPPFNPIKEHAMPDLASEAYQHMLKAAESNDHQSLMWIFDQANIYEAKGEFKSAIQAYKNAAIAYRRANGDLQSEVIKVKQDHGHLRARSAVLEDWVRSRRLLRRRLPVPARGLTAGRIRELMVEVGQDKSCKTVLWGAEQAVAANGENAFKTLIVVMQDIFGLGGSRKHLIDSDLYAWAGIELLTLELERRAQRFQIQHNPPPALRLPVNACREYYATVGLLMQLRVEHHDRAPGAIDTTLLQSRLAAALATYSALRCHDYVDIDVLKVETLAMQETLLTTRARHRQITLALAETLRELELEPQLAPEDD